jgi:hypothetical protein
MMDEEEYESLRCQIGTSKSMRGGRRYLPYAFTIRVPHSAFAGGTPKKLKGEGG